MHECGDVNEFHDHGEVNVSGIDPARGAASEQSQERAETFATAAHRINYIPLDCGIECRSLLCDASLDLFEMWMNQARHFSERKRLRGAGVRNCAADCAGLRAGGEFHEARITGRQ